MRKRSVWLALLAGLLMLTLTGCFFRSVDELYTVPQPSEDYQALQVRLAEVVAQGGEYAAPQSGEMIQSVQRQDLDGDGRQEVIAFFRFAGEDKPLKIYIFRQAGDTYEEVAVIEGAATAINRVDYVQMDDDRYKEIVVSWQLSAIHTLAVYSVGLSQVEELIRTDYDSYRLFDLDQDNQQELVVFRTPPDALPRAEFYNFDGVLSLAGEAPISSGAFLSGDGNIKSDYFTSLQTGYLAGRVPAIFATAAYGEYGAITDIFACQGGRLRNITMDPETGESVDTIRYYTPPAIWDINSDGIMEVPQTEPLAEYNRSPLDAVNFWLVRWQQFDLQGNAQTVSVCYYNDRDSWYFTIPEEWTEHLVLSRSDLTSSGERAVTFSWREGNGEPAPFLTIYKLTGTNRATRAKRGQRFIITPRGAEDSTIYAAEFRDGWDCGLSQEEVMSRLAVITPDWYNE